MPKRSGCLSGWGVTWLACRLSVQFGNEPDWACVTGASAAVPRSASAALTAAVGFHPGTSTCSRGLPVGLLGHQGVDLGDEAVRTPLRQALERRLERDHRPDPV